MTITMFTPIELPPTYYISLHMNVPISPLYPWGMPYTRSTSFSHTTTIYTNTNTNTTTIERKDSGICIPSNTTSRKPSTITINPKPTTTTYAAPSRWTTLTSPAEQTKALDFLTNNYHTIQTLQAANYTITPDTTKNNIRFQQTPNTNNPSARRAVSLDCEMITDTTGRTQLCQVSMVDVLTGELLLDQAVLPSEPVSDWRTKWSGMTAELMAQHVAAGKTVNGYEGARARVWEYIDQKTILVGQSLNFDLDVLGIVHERIVDTYLLMRGQRRGRSCRLRDVVRDCCGVEIQRGEEVEGGHDCAEDCYAAREVALWAAEHLGRDEGGGSTRSFCVESFM
ncbi:hypothetical protein M752DRAFT_276268 [Aspergillus phoenicis ATCC 13157]|uniref:Exonuclease domain-containing protein n=1 Tax=Aspergillus phoenicis ATCC 13157 TaxID=1353007 RepID=A0A370PJC0_ASPPH|nr:hypothetical protein M752DRAFT_276268 [Aspergillus phoenicis ATCC 13157]GLA28339.1 hypothetical protein AnigIFM63326_005911 [Aspergillus niger]